MEKDIYIKLKRLCALVIDYYIVSAVCSIPILIFVLIKSFIIQENDIFNLLNYVISIGTIFYIIFLPFKDIINGNSSIGKKVMQLEIKNNNNNEIPTNFRLILRNLFLIIWPIEGLLILIFNRRLGDIICNTKVVYKN